ncbi:MAG TPA: toll/interleukin-1 receptor domain-containing protein [Arachnia sp.]|nr:toll/interleukin-1 receptor domain-containing protein [Arachnia sp.]HMT84926.1 toll/interleukin-1 receptor domain-containing protein [Arachnia sp.]
MNSRQFEPGREGRFAFISHSHIDQGRGFGLLAPLAKEGYQLWYDEGLTPTVSWEEELRQTIKDCALFVMLISRVSVNREQVLKEVLIAEDLGKPILTLYLDDTALPERIRFLGRLQGIEVWKRSFEDALGKVRGQLLAYDVSQLAVEEGADEDDAWDLLEEPDPDDSKPRMDTVDTSLTSAFADRVPESEALTNSVAHMRRALLGERRVDGEESTNVLVFYGGGGVGKSGLSQKLESWVAGEGAEISHWGPWVGGSVIPVRWDFNDSKGDIQFAKLMRTLRQALAREVKGDDGVSRPLITRRFLRFDLALAAYLEAVTAPDRQSLELTGKAAADLLASLQQLSSIQKAGIPAELNAANVQQVVERALHQGPERLFQGFSLRGFLEECERIPQGSDAPELVAKLVYILTEEIYRMPKAERPALVFFLDHFEKVQRESGRSHESNLTRIVKYLPYSLFVVTGRNKLHWADPKRTDLAFRGPTRWPWLTDQEMNEPRQHSLGRLSEEDTADLYRNYRDTYSWNMSDELIERLVRRSDGLPLHIEAVLKLTFSLNESAPGRELTAEELDKELDEVVLRLMNVLSVKERDAFRAACVLPFFDSRLVEVIGDVHAGDVANAITYALVEQNRDSSYPYRVHDEIRKLVRQDRASEGYWGDEAWLAAARRGLDEAKRRIVAAHDAEAESEETQAIALAIRIAAEWGLETTDRERQEKTELERMVTRAPSIVLIGHRLPPPSSGEPASPVETLIRLVHASGLPYEQGIEALQELGNAPGRAAVIARRFAAYRLRALSRYDEALELLAVVIASVPEEANYTKKQYAMTLRSARRFEDALLYLEAELPAESRPRRFRAICDRRHGDFSSDTPAARAANRRATKSARVQLEQDVSWLVVDAYQGRVGETEVLELLDRSTRRKHRGSIRTCLRVLAYFHLADESKLNEIIARIKRGIDEDETNGLTVPHLLALRALLTHDPDHARVAYESVRPGPRGAVSIPVEVWLEELGYPLEPVETQWLIPYEQVRENWLKVAAGIIERAKGFAAT